MVKRLCFVGATLTIGNFVWQTIAGHNWGSAVERSYFEAVALLTAYATLRYWPVQPS